MNQIENNLSLKVAKKMMAALKFRQQRDIYYKRTIKEITVTEQMLIDKFNSQKGLCYWSGLRLDDKYNLLSKHPFSISVERLNNDLGYTPDNIVLTRRIFNLGRSDFSESEFLNVINDLKEELKG
jgi:hypothetical protein